MNHHSPRQARRRRIADRLAVATLFLPLYAAVLWAYRGDRKAGVR